MWRKCKIEAFRDAIRHGVVCVAGKVFECFLWAWKVAWLMKPRLQNALMSVSYICGKC